LEQIWLSNHKQCFYKEYITHGAYPYYSKSLGDLEQFFASSENSQI